MRVGGEGSIIALESGMPDFPLRVAKIRTSDRYTFKRCRRKWDWSYSARHNRDSADSRAPLWTGTGFHFALEDFHAHKIYPTAADAFRAYSMAWERMLKSKDAPHVKMLERCDWDEQVILATSMLDYYETNWLEMGRDGLETFIWNGKPQVEVRFEIEIPLDPEYVKKCGYDKVVYQGSIDRVIIDEYGRLWVCVAKDTWVYNGSGFCKIQDHPDAKYNGVRKTIRVNTSRGYHVECTPDHQILTHRGWIEASKLVAGDILFQYPNYEMKRASDTPENEDFWWTLGFWLGDGNLRNHGRGSINFSVGKDRDSLEPRLAKFFQLAGETPRYAAHPTSTGYLYVTNQAKFADYIRELFATPWGTKYQKRLHIPLDKVQNIAAFLSGLFDADGSVSKPDERGQRGTIDFSTKSKQLASDVQVALGAFQIACTVREQKRSAYTWYSLCISDAGSMQRFRHFIGFSIPRKAERLDQCLINRKAKPINAPIVTTIEEGPEVEVYDLLDQPNNRFAANGLIVHNCEYKTAKRFETGHFDVDSQITAYAWACEVIYNLPFAGVVYQQHKKVVTQEPKWLETRGMYSVAKSQATTYALYRRALEKRYGQVIKAPTANILYLNDLAALETNFRDDFIRRDYISRNRHQIWSVEQDIIAEAYDMINPKIALYKNPTRDCSWDCPFQMMCVMKDDGSDWVHEMEQSTIDRDEVSDKWRQHLPPLQALQQLSPQELLDQQMLEVMGEAPQCPLQEYRQEPSVLQVPREQVLQIGQLILHRQVEGPPS